MFFYKAKKHTQTHTLSLSLSLVLPKQILAEYNSICCEMLQQEASKLIHCSSINFLPTQRRSHTVLVSLAGEGSKNAYHTIIEESKDKNMRYAQLLEWDLIMYRVDSTLFQSRLGLTPRILSQLKK